jgi:hypothetical protein
MHMTEFYRENTIGFFFHINSFNKGLEKVGRG